MEGGESVAGPKITTSRRVASHPIPSMLIVAVRTVEESEVKDDTAVSFVGSRRAATTRIVYRPRRPTVARVNREARRTARTPVSKHRQIATGDKD